MSMQLRHARGLALAAAAAALALGLALAAAAAADARGQATAIGLIATMNAPSEVPAPAGDVSGARGAFTATATQSGAGADAPVADDVHRAHRSRDGRAHPHRGTAAGRARWSCRSAAPCTSPASGTATVDAAAARGAPVGRRLRQRPHGHEQGRRDPRPGRRRTLPCAARSRRGRRCRSPRATSACRRHVRRHRHDGGDDRLRHLAAELRTAVGSRRRGAHPHRPGGTGGAGRRRPVRPVPERPARERGS